MRITPKAVSLYWNNVSSPEAARILLTLSPFTLKMSLTDVRSCLANTLRPFSLFPRSFSQYADVLTTALAAHCTSPQCGSQFHATDAFAVWVPFRYCPYRRLTNVSAVCPCLAVSLSVHAQVDPPATSLTLPWRRSLGRGLHRATARTVPERTRPGSHLLTALQQTAITCANWGSIGGLSGEASWHVRSQVATQLQSELVQSWADCQPGNQMSSSPNRTIFCRLVKHRVVQVQSVHVQVKYFLGGAPCLVRRVVHSRMPDKQSRPRAVQSNPVQVTLPVSPPLSPSCWLFPVGWLLCWEWPVKKWAPDRCVRSPPKRTNTSFFILFCYSHSFSRIPLDLTTARSECTTILVWQTIPLISEIF